MGLKEFIENTLRYKHLEKIIGLAKRVYEL